MTVSKREAHRLAKKAAELDANVLRGVLKVGPNGTEVDARDVLEWLAQHADQEILLIAAPVSDGLSETLVRTCQTCGRDFTSDRCDHCAEVRSRLRG